MAQELRFEEDAARESPVHSRFTALHASCCRMGNESTSSVGLAAGDVSTLLLHMLPNPGSLPAVGFPALRCPEGFHFKEGTLYRTLYWRKFTTTRCGAIRW